MADPSATLSEGGPGIKLKLRYLIAVMTVMSLLIGGFVWHVRAQRDTANAAVRAAIAAEADAVARTK